MLQSALGKKVDLVEYETIRPELKENILRDEILILKSEKQSDCFLDTKNKTANITA